MKTLRREGAALKDTDLKNMFIREVSEAIVNEGLEWTEAHKNFKKKVKDKVDAQRAALMCQFIEDQCRNTPDMEIETDKKYVFTCLSGEQVECQMMTAKDVDGTTLEHDGGMDCFSDTSTVDAGTGGESSAESDDGDGERRELESKIRFTRVGAPMLREEKLEKLHEQLGQQMLNEMDRCKVIKDENTLNSQDELQQIFSLQRNYYEDTDEEWELWRSRGT